MVQFDEQHTDGDLFKIVIAIKLKMYFVNLPVTKQNWFGSQFIHKHELKFEVTRVGCCDPTSGPLVMYGMLAAILSSLTHVVAVTVTPANFLFQRRHPTLIGNNARKQIPLARLPSQKNAWESGAGARSYLSLPSGQSWESSRAQAHQINPTRMRLSVYLDWDVSLKKYFLLTFI